MKKNLKFNNQQIYYKNHHLKIQMNKKISMKSIQNLKLLMKINNNRDNQIVIFQNKSQLKPPLNQKNQKSLNSEWQRKQNCLPI